MANRSPEQALRLESPWLQVAKTSSSVPFLRDNPFVEHELALLSPEKTILTYRLASIGGRIFAHLIDVTVVFAVIVLAGIFVALSFMAPGVAVLTSTAFLVFLIAPAVHRRVVWFTEKRLNATMPLSPQEVRAQKDMARAPFAAENAKTEQALTQEGEDQHQWQEQDHVGEVGEQRRAEIVDEPDDEAADQRADQAADTAEDHHDESER